MLQHHELIEALKSQLKKESDDSIAMSSHSEIDLSAEGEKKLISDLFEVLGHAEENDPNPDAKSKRRVKVQLEKW
jgi:ABC-type Fe3+-citrate transport system substrate-binding protein